MGELEKVVAKVASPVDVNLFANERRCLDALATHQVAFLVVGGCAVRVHGSTRIAKDIDVLIANTYENADRLCCAMNEIGISHPNLCPEEIHDRKRQINFESWGYQFEVLTAADNVDFAAAYSRHVTASLAGLEVPVMSRQDLISMKRQASRPIDIEDLAFLEGTPNNHIQHGRDG